MRKVFKMLMIAACPLGFVACSDDDEPTVNPDQPTVAEGVFVLNQGSYYSQIEGSLTLYDYKTGTAAQNIFQRANGRSLGATPQGATVYGNKIYLAIYESNVIEIIDRNTYKSQKQISLSDATGQGPRSIIAKDGKVYISMFNGYVSRLDTLTLNIDKTVKVGPNPEIMAIRGDYLYVPNSDGMNYLEGYGTTASKIDLRNFQVVSTFDVPLNPGQFVSNGTDLFLLAKGNYADIASKVYRIDSNDASKEICEATLFDVKDNKLYFINAPYYFTADQITYGIYDITTGKTTKMLTDSGVDSPAAIAVDPLNGNIIITSYSMDNGYASYNTDGYAKIYSPNGALTHTFTVGVGPCAVFFNYK